KNPGCQTPHWEQPTRTPHALWLWNLSGTSYPRGLDDIVIGRYAIKGGFRYEILDDEMAGFQLLQQGGQNWGAGASTPTVATGDVDGDGRDEIVLGRHAIKKGSFRFGSSMMPQRAFSSLMRAVKAGATVATPRPSWPRRDRNWAIRALGGF